MKNYNFIPTWYKSLRARRQEKVLLIILILLCVSNIFTIRSLFERYNNVLKIKKQVINMNNKDNIRMEDALKEELKVNVTDIIVLDIYDKIKACINYEVTIKEIEILNSDATMVIETGNEEKYISIIKKIESNKNWTIKSLSPLKYSNGIVTFNITLKIL